MHEDRDHVSRPYVYSDLGLTCSSARRALLVLALSVAFVAVTVALGPEAAHRTALAPPAPPVASSEPDTQPLLSNEIESCGFAEACAGIFPAAPVKITNRNAKATRLASATPLAGTIAATAPR